MSTRFSSQGVPIDWVEASAYKVPTDRPESDGTFAWDHTTLVLVEVSAGGRRGLGYTYGAAGAAWIVRDSLADAVRGTDAFAVAAAHAAMVRAVRNIGAPGVAVSKTSVGIEGRISGASAASVAGRLPS